VVRARDKLWLGRGFRFLYFKHIFIRSGNVFSANHSVLHNYCNMTDAFRRTKKANIEIHKD